MFKTKTPIALTTAVLLSFGGFALTGCSTLKNISQTTGIGTETFQKENTDDADRKNYTTVQDVNGNEYLTIIKITQVGTNEVDQEKLSNELTSLNTQWSQMIVSDAMGTKQQQYCYLFFPSTVTMKELQKCVDSLVATGEWDSHLIQQAEYDEYLNSVAGTVVNIYHTEMTYTGPAANTNNTK